jgi:hypothetical protein
MVEIRDNFLDLYSLGHSVEVKGTEKTGYYLSASKTFNPHDLLPEGQRGNIICCGYGKWQIFFGEIERYSQFEEIMKAVISKIVVHKKGNISEGVSEINHFIDNRSIGKNGVLVIDRQIVYPGMRESRMDLLGITRLGKNTDKFTFSIIELKNKNNTEIGKVFTQTKRYIDLLYDNKDIYERFRITYQKVLEQKIRLRLLKRVKCEIATWGELTKKDIKGVVIMDNFNIKSDIRADGLLHRAIQDWKDVDKTYDIKLFMKTNVLDNTFFMNADEASRLLRAYKRCNS